MGELNESAIRAWLGLDESSLPSPAASPIEFLMVNLRFLPPHLLQSFSNITSPKDRSRLPAIRNRRLKYSAAAPELRFAAARNNWPLLYEGTSRPTKPGGEEEKAWVQNDFLDGRRKHVGKLGELLSGYEDEREGERLRALRREKAEAEFVPEEEEDSDSDDEGPLPPEEPVTEGVAKASFERLIRERFIYGLLDGVDYDRVDWDESLDGDTDRESEERWFDEEEED
ncbi:unnamed protein product [Mycena citricolor]|uniref:CCD97-like C-terminal domain-containing protein n=1 Tax=Mycena citricolor TaxID=2018698 RepID=A0AAD2K2U0_9AGAR|nr:unnamed protein product [Mycena citricolor]